MYSYKIFRLIIIVFMITYIIACFWWFLVRHVNTKDDEANDNTFITSNLLDEVFSGDVPPECYRENCDLDTTPDTHPCRANKLNATEFQVFKTWREEECKPNILTLVIIVCYFALTTLSTVGYGDYFPISINEILIGIGYMLIGIVCFSQIMGSFIEII